MHVDTYTTLTTVQHTHGRFHSAILRREGECYPQAGFTLIELAIVLVIIALMAAGITAGDSLIRASELRSITTEFKQYQTAVKSFADKYNAIPGDMETATQFWGAATCPAGTGTGTQTCNGDGDGILDAAAAASQTGEGFRFWQHLVNAGMIEGSFSGNAGSGSTTDTVIGTNVPQSKFDAAGWSVSYAIMPYADANLFSVDMYNIYLFGYDNGTAANDAKTLTPEDTWNIDKKIDDGRPARGMVIAKFWNNACANGTSAADLNATYRLSDRLPQCALFFTKAF